MKISAVMASLCDLYECLPIIFKFTSDFQHKIVVGNAHNIFDIYELREYSRSKGHTFLSTIIGFSCRMFQIYCPVWVKFSVRGLHIMLFRICDFRENRLKRSVHNAVQYWWVS